MNLRVHSLNLSSAGRYHARQVGTEGVSVHSSFQYQIAVERSITRHWRWPLSQRWWHRRRGHRFVDSCITGGDINEIHWSNIKFWTFSSIPFLDRESWWNNCLVSRVILSDAEFRSLIAEILYHPFKIHTRLIFILQSLQSLDHSLKVLNVNWKPLIYFYNCERSGTLNLFHQT